MYRLGQASLDNLHGVHPDLMQIIMLAIQISDQDFGVTERQVRDLAYQKLLVQRGVSKTLKSNHLEQKDLTGKTQNLYGHAVDLVPWNGTKFVWEWPRVYHVAAAMALAAKQLSKIDKLCWGGVWDRWMSDYTQSVAITDKIMQQAQTAYCIRHPGPDFIDGPHFQLYKKG